MLRILFLFAAIIILPSISMAQKSEIFAVQIGTYEKFAADNKRKVRNFDNVHVFTFKNKSRVTVGEFTRRENATELLKKLKSIGFSDAFIRRTGYVDLDNARSTIEKFNILISEMDAKAFYLDGDMYIFQGTGYIKIHHLNPKQVSNSRQTLNLNPNNNFLLLGTY
ncbi:MAG: SPOR domain-containing protein [Gammaproteobacteria bacterium]|nr:SPOR domain-containing protein [Gammaproteobacteria bacterium]